MDLHRNMEHHKGAESEAGQEVGGASHSQGSTESIHSPYKSLFGLLLHQTLPVSIGTRLSVWKRELKSTRTKWTKKEKRGKNRDAEGDSFTNTRVGGLLVT